MSVLDSIWHRFYLVHALVLPIEGYVTKTLTVALYHYDGYYMYFIDDFGVVAWSKVLDE
jgi:hypothetical protein